MLTLTRPTAPGAGEVLDRVHEVPSGLASAAARSVYDDSMQVLRVPVVDVLLRLLANYPAFLENAWFYMKGNLVSVYAEAQADHLRDRSLLRFRPPGYSDPEMLLAAGVTDEQLARIRAWHVTQQYLIPKLMVFAAAWDAALAGLAVGGARQPLEEFPLVPSGIADGTLSLPLLDPRHAPPRAAEVLAGVREIRGYPVVHDYYRGLANWPDYLDRLRADIRSAATLDEYVQRADELWWMARAAVHGLPYEIPAGASWVKGYGLREAQVLEIRSILDLFARRVYPETLLDIAIARTFLDGEDAAGVSRLSLTARAM